MRMSTPLLQSHTLQICMFFFVHLEVNESVTSLIGGHKTMDCLSGKGHGKNDRYLFLPSFAYHGMLLNAFEYVQHFKLLLHAVVYF